MPERSHRRPPRLLAISHRRSHDGGDLGPWLRRLAEAGVDTVQLREKNLDDLELYALARRARALLPPPRRLSINGRADLALAAGADGVHLPAAGLPVAALRARFGELLIGRSTHHPEEVAAAARDGADYVTFGPVYPTPSKAGYGPPPGLDGLRRAVAVGLPVVALGGVGPRQVAEVVAAGAAGVAGIRAFSDAGSLAEMIAAAAAALPV